MNNNNYVNFFRGVIESSLNDYDRKRHFPELFLYKPVNLINNENKLKLITHFYNKGLDSKVISKIMGGSSMYKELPISKSQRNNLYNYVRSFPKANTRLKIFKNTADKAKQKLIKTFVNGYKNKMKYYEDKLNKLSNNIKKYEDITKRKISLSSISDNTLDSIKKDYIIQKIKFYEKLKEIGKNITNITTNIFNQSKNVDNNVHNVVKNLIYVYEMDNKNKSHNPMLYFPFDFFAMFLAHLDYIKSNMNSLINDNMFNVPNINNINKSKLKKYFQNEFNYIVSKN